MMCESTLYRGDALRRSLEQLALPSDQQRVLIQSLGLYPLVDELALEFDDEWRVFEARYSQDPTRLTLYQTLHALSSIFDAMTPGDWHVDGLEGYAWQSARRMARLALELGIA